MQMRDVIVWMRHILVCMLLVLCTAIAREGCGAHMWCRAPPWPEHAAAVRSGVSVFGDLACLKDLVYLIQLMGLRRPKLHSGVKKKSFRRHASP
jgi:hypothetical protein